MTHYRGANITWDVDASNEAHFVVQGAWRASFIDNIVLDFGDGNSVSLAPTILSSNSEYAVVRYETTHQYAATGNFTASFQSCCRISTLDDGHADDSFRSETVVNVGSGNHNPTTSLPPIIQVADNQIFTLQIPAIDSDGDALTYRFGTASEFITPGAGSSAIHPVGSTLSSTGLFTWDVRDIGGANVSDGDQYVVTFMVEDGDSKTPIDVILQIVAQGAEQHSPIISSVAPQVTPVGESDEVTLFATDADGNLQSIQALNPPPGLVTHYHPDDGELHVTFTPTAAQAGQTFVVNFEARDATGLTSQTSITFTVPAANTAPVADNDAYNTAHQQPLVINAANGVLNGDTDAEGSPLSAVLNAGPQHGKLSLNADGSFTYTPDSGFSGSDSFTYHANDGSADSNIATVTINVGGPTPPSSGIIFGNTDISPLDIKSVSDNGSGANDKLQSGFSSGAAYQGFQQFHGGGGNDTFILRAKDFGAVNEFGINKYITDFQGAGGWSAASNDFLALTGFGAGSTLTYETSRATGGSGPDTLDVYRVHDSATNADSFILIHSMNGKQLATGDYAFYA